jgi:hypothetical protein
LNVNDDDDDNNDDNKNDDDNKSDDDRGDDDLDANLDVDVEDERRAVWSWLRQLGSRSASQWQSCRRSWWASRTASVSLKASWPRMRP